MAKYRSYNPTKEQLKKQGEYEKLAQLLADAEILAKELDDYAQIRDWFDDLCNADAIEGYGYTVELKEEIESLNERLYAYPAELPKIENMVDQAKYEFFTANFSKIPLDALEWVVATVAKNKLAV